MRVFRRGQRYIRYHRFIQPEGIATMFVLKHNDSFAVLDAQGDAFGRNEKEHDIADGLITRDTRMISKLVLTVNGERPQLQHSSLEDNNVILHVESRAGGAALRRMLFVWQDALHEKITLTNAEAEEKTFTLKYDVEADFTDLFELRGAQRPARGKVSAPEADSHVLVFHYRAVDGAGMASTAAFSAPFDQSDTRAARFHITLAAGESRALYARYGAGTGAASEADFSAALENSRGFIARQIARRPRFESSNQAFDQWLHANAVDIALLTSETDSGLYPYAGIPWYSCPFGRDALITSFQLLWQDPELAKGVLGLLAKHQAREESAFHDSAPGKILHEIRKGEMARLKEIPHTPYYGTADATPLFISLAGAYFERTGDKAFIATLWPHIERALHWIDTYGDRDGDGFVEYQRGAESGLGNQGWKDSQDSISHADGRLAPGPIALCEVQGYVYDAKRTAALIAKGIGHDAAAVKLEQQAEALKEKFNDAYWLEDIGTYAIALDGDKKPCVVSSSNPGHLLFSGIATPERAKRTAENLMSPAMFSGWGIRTLGSSEKRYEPVEPPEGYHNGTVWVHDTAIAASGFARYGMEAKAATLMTALFEAAQHFEGFRLPELFGGLPRVEGQPPARYPVACSPQAWASASESMLLQAMLGIRVNGIDKTVTVDNPALPPWLDTLAIHDLKIGASKISLKFARQDGATSVVVIDKSPDITCHLAG